MIRFRPRAKGVGRNFFWTAPSYAKPTLVVAGCLWFIASIAVSFNTFDINPINLNDQDSESVQLFHELAKGVESPVYAVSVVAENEEEANSLVADFDRVASIKSINTVRSLIPSKQAEKLDLIDETALILGEDLAVGQNGDLEPDELIKTLNDLHRALAEYNASPRASDESIKLNESITGLIETSQSLPEAEQHAFFRQLESKLMASFKGRVDRLNDGLLASGITIATLPEIIKQRWISDGGKYRVEVIPRDELAGSSVLRRFVNDIRNKVGDRATGAPVINVGGADAVQDAFIQAFCSALLIIAFLLWLILRSVKEVLISIFPLLLAGLLTSAIMVLFGLKFNFANIIALPLLLGIGVDSSLHIIHRYKTSIPRGGSILQTSTARAVLFSAATTAVSFGNLAISNHAGTAGMGIVLSIGIVCTLFCMLVILPAMLVMFVQPKFDSAELPA